MLTLDMVQRLNAPKTNEIISIPAGEVGNPSNYTVKWQYPAYDGPKQGWYEYYELLLTHYTSHQRNTIYWSISNYII